MEEEIRSRRLTSRHRGAGQAAAEQRGTELATCWVAGLLGHKLVSQVKFR